MRYPLFRNATARPTGRFDLDYLVRRVEKVHYNLYAKEQRLGDLHDSPGRRPLTTITANG
jgi:hypothetical protein